MTSHPASVCIGLFLTTYFNKMHNQQELNSHLNYSTCKTMQCPKKIM